jgi:putative transposase
MSNASSIRLRHTVTRLTVHLVWATRDRRPWLDPSIDARLSELISRKPEELGCRAIAVGNACDHVHVLVSHPPTLTVANIAHRLKGASSRILAGHLPDGFE